VHSSTCAEALQRIVSAFAAEIQSAVRAQLADCLVGVICQRLRYKPDLKIRVPECEIVTASLAVRSAIRSGDFFKIASAIETGADSGMWTWTRYQGWLDKKKTWNIPEREEEAEGESAENARPDLALPILPARSDAVSRPAPSKSGPAQNPAAPGASNKAPGSRIEIEPVEGGLNELLKKLEGP
jgi:twitching motility protein PilT